MSVGTNTTRPDTRVLRRSIQVRNPRHRPVPFSGSVTFAAATTLAGTGLDALKVGQLIKHPTSDGDHHFRKITAINSAIELEIESAYAGSVGAATPVVHREVGRQLSPLPQGEYVNAGDLGWGQQVPIPPGAVQTMPVTAQNIFALRSAVFQGSLEIADDRDSWFSPLGSGGEQAPVVEFIDVLEGTQTGEVSIRFKLYLPNTSSAAVDIDMEWDTDPAFTGATAAVAGTGGTVTSPDTGLAAAADGTEYTFVWNTAAAAGNDVYFRIRCEEDGSATPGTEDRTGLITVVV